MTNLHVCVGKRGPLRVVGFHVVNGWGMGEVDHGDDAGMRAVFVSGLNGAGTGKAEAPKELWVRKGLGPWSPKGVTGHEDEESV